MSRRLAHSRRAALVALLALTALGAEVATAEDFWARATRSKADDRYRNTIAGADAYARRAAELATDSFPAAAAERRGEVQALALRAVAAYEEAIALDADQAEPHYRAAEVLNAHFVSSVDHPNPAPATRSIAHWVEFERLAPRDPRLTNLYFRRSIAYTKLGGDDNLRLAIADYDRQLGHIDAASERPEWLATVTANSAELSMGVGDLDRAITLYREALEAFDSALHGYGLAVALDRDGQGFKAREIMQSYAASDRLAALLGAGVFFVPDGEIHYYQALGHEALREFESAANHYRQFLRLIPGSRYAERARQNLRAVDARRAAEPRRAPRMPSARDKGR